jgi:hypothetical protein
MVVKSGMRGHPGFADNVFKPYDRLAVLVGCLL